MPVLFSGVQFDILDKDDVTLTPKELIEKLDKLNWGKGQKPNRTKEDFFMFGFDKKFKLRNFRVNGEKLERSKSTPGSRRAACVRRYTPDVNPKLIGAPGGFYFGPGANLKEHFPPV